MAASLSALITQMTKDDVVASILSVLQAAGFPTTSWATTSVPRRLIDGFATALADATALVANLARGGYRSLAVGGWLDMLGEDFFSEARRAAVSTVGTFKLTDHGGGPHTIADGAVWVRDSAGRKYVSVVLGAPVTLALNSDAWVSFRAEAPGESYNIPTGSTLELVTSLPTVTVANPVVAPTSTWITTSGVDEESDADYAQRLAEKWSTVGAGVEAAYAFHAKATLAVTRVRVYAATPSGGYVTIIVAGPSGAVTAGNVATVLAYLNDGRVPLCVTPVVASATNRSLTAGGTVYVTASKRAAAQAAIATAIATYQAELEIGGTVRVAELVQRVMDVDGAINFTPTRFDGTNLPATPGTHDYALGTTEVAIFDISALTYVEA